MFEFEFWRNSAPKLLPTHATANAHTRDRGWSRTACRGAPHCAGPLAQRRRPFATGDGTTRPRVLAQSRTCVIPLPTGLSSPANAPARAHALLQMLVATSLPAVGLRRPANTHRRSDHTGAPPSHSARKTNRMPTLKIPLRHSPTACTCPIATTANRRAPRSAPPVADLPVLPGGP